MQARGGTDLAFRPGPLLLRVNPSGASRLSERPSRIKSLEQSAISVAGRSDALALSRPRRRLSSPSIAGRSGCPFPRRAPATP
jgi:hypothetical protein